MTQDDARPSPHCSTVLDQSPSALPGHPRADAPRPSFEALADELRARCWPEGTFPVDPVVVASRMGLEVFSAQLDHDVISVLLDDGLYVGVDLPPKRCRVSVARELGHRVVSAAVGQVVDAHVSRRSASSRPVGADAAAQRFALALLVPADVLAQHDRAGMSDLESAEAFGVSVLDLASWRQLMGTSGARR